MRWTGSLTKIMIIFALLGAVFVEFSFGNEFRVWKDLKGRTLNASLVKIEGDEVVLLFKNGQEVRIQRSKLSADDNQFLDENKGPLKAKSFSLLPEKEVKIDTKSFEKLKEPLMLPDFPVKFGGIKTKHFLVITDDRSRLDNLAETAERLWHGMDVRHPTFSRKWGNRRKAIFFVEDPDVQTSLGEWAAKTYEAAGRKEQADGVRFSWDESTTWSFLMPPEFAQKNQLFGYADLVKPKKIKVREYLKLFDPTTTYSLASSLLFFQTDGVRRDRGKGNYFLIGGHALFKKIQLAGRDDSSFTNAAFESGSIVSGREFKEVTEWPSILKGLIRKKKVSPEVKALYVFHEEGLTPDATLLIYGFNYYLHSTPERVKAYAKLIEMIAKSHRIPEPLELAAVFGFETLEGLQKDWVDFMDSREFK